MQRFPERIAVLEADHRHVEPVLAEAADGVSPVDPDRPRPRSPSPRRPRSAPAASSRSFTRLVHMLTAPLGYLTRPYIVYRSRDDTRLGTRPPRRGWERVG